jgi:hypothetical protein
VRESQTALLTIIGGGVALAGLLLTKNRLDHNRAEHRTKQFKEAAELLGHAQMDVRQAGIYTLQQLMRDNPHEVGVMVCNLLASYVNNRGGQVTTALDNRKGKDQKAPLFAKNPPSVDPYTDIIAALQVLAERELPPDIEAKVDFNLDRISWLYFPVHNHGFNAYEVYASKALVDKPEKRKLVTKTDEKNYRFANLDHAQLSYANLNHADLDNVYAESAEFQNASLYCASMEKIWLSSSNLTNANLEEALLTNGRLMRSVLTGAILINAMLKSADLNCAEMKGADLTCARLTQANLQDVNLDEAVLRYVMFENANLQGATFSIKECCHCIISGANLLGATGFTVDDCVSKTIRWNEKTIFPDGKRYQPATPQERQSFGWQPTPVTD